MNKTLVAWSYFLSCDSDNHCSTNIGAHLKEWLHSWNSSQWRILYWMETTFASVDVIYGFTQSIFVNTTEHTWVFKTFVNSRYWSSRRIKIITDKLDEIYLQEPNTSWYMTFKEFSTYKRAFGININDFLVRWKFLYQKLQTFGITLTVRVQAFFVLNAVNLSEENKKLSRTMCESLNYETMKETLKKSAFWCIITGTQKCSCG